MRDAARLATDLQRSLASPGAVVLDCTGLTDIDLSIVQVLVAAHKTASASGRALSLKTALDGPLPRLLQAAGFLAADGRALTPEGTLWTGMKDQAA